MKKKLRDLADIRTGYQFRGKVVPSDDANVAVIQIKDVDEERVVRTAELVSVESDKPEPYLVTRGDVLFLSRGHRLYAAVVSEPIRDTIATGYFFILRPDVTVIHPEYLAWAINGPEFQEALRPYVRGSHIPLVSKTDFQSLLLCVPPLDVQRQVLKLQELSRRERRLTETIQAKRQQLIEAITHNLIQGTRKAPGAKP